MSEFDRSLAVVIGINEYQNGIDALQTAVPDAIAFHNKLTMNNNGRIISLANQASIALKQKDYQTALDAYAQALKIAREEKLFRFTAVILNYIGDTFQAQGEIQDAVIAYEAALKALQLQDKLKVESVIDRLGQVSKGFYEV